MIGQVLKNVRASQALVLTKLPKNHKFQYADAKRYLEPFDNQHKIIYKLVGQGYLERLQGGRGKTTWYQLTDRGREIADAMSDYWHNY